MTTLRELHRHCLHRGHVGVDHRRRKRRHVARLRELAVIGDEHALPQRHIGALADVVRQSPGNNRQLDRATLHGVRVGQREQRLVQQSVVRHKQQVPVVDTCRLQRGDHRAPLALRIGRHYLRRLFVALVPHR